MSNRIHRYRGIILPLSFLITTAAFGDTLKLNDGNILKGQYMGGTEDTVRFEVAGAVQEIPSNAVVSLTFSGAAPVPVPAKKAAPEPVTIPAGTPIHFKFSQGLSSRAAAGLQFKGILETAVIIGNKVVVPAGSPVYGQVTESKKGGRLVRRAELGLTLTHIVIRQKRYPVSTAVYKGKGERQGTAKKVGAGAAIGAIAGGGRGARIGAAVGTGLAVLSPGKQVNIPAGTIMEFQLRAAVTVK